MRHDRSTSNGGFALAEALVSLVLLGMIAVMIVNGIDTGRRVWQRTQSVSMPGESVEAAHLTLRGVIERAYPAVHYESNPPSVEFDGTPNHLTFKAPARDSRRPSELQRYTLSLTDAGELALSFESDLATDPNAEPSQIILLKDVQNIQIDYFGAAAPDYVPRWQSNWERQPAMPTLVRLRLEFASGDRRWWPTLIVRPLARINLGTSMRNGTRNGAQQ